MKAVTLVGCVALSWCVAGSVLAQLPAVERRQLPEVPILTVSGTGEAEAAPDRAVVRLGAVAQAAKADEAQAEVNEVVARAIDEIKRLGVKAPNISTAGITLSPVYSQPDPRGGGNESFVPRIKAYQASNTVEVRVTDLAKVGQVIDAGVASGANNVESLTFDLRDDTDARRQALTEAVRQARAKADAIASAMGLRIVEVREIDEGGGEGQPIPMMARGVRVMAAEAMSTPVQPGQVRVTATVTVRYQVAAGEEKKEKK